ncbi:MAG: glycosyltransferase, partial [Lentisphaerae bacterium]|nr:glycosyltransferase [Lentisphaerota bacterium]
MKLAVILVHYHSPELARRACEALARDAGEVELETVLVDNGSRPEDLEILESLPARRVDPGGNLGYAGGANAGVRETSADWVAVMNPDVEVLPGCLGALAEALENGAAAAGPRFFWDHGKQYQLPPTEP